MDGVIVDSERHWKEAAAEFWRQIAPSWGEADDRHAVGLAVEELFEYARREKGVTLSRPEFMSRTQALARDVYARRVGLAEGFLPLLDELARRKITAAVASSSPPAWLGLVFTRFSLQAAFAAVVNGRDIPLGRRKPHPDPYLLVCERLKIAPKDALAIEDSSHGIKSAKAAGLCCAAFITPFNEGHELPGADFSMRGFTGDGYAALISRLS